MPTSRCSHRPRPSNWTSPQAGRWREELLKNSIIPIQQFQNTVGKNATDSALIIDAMDILYTPNVDGFCIVSSDSDFTRLASRLRESGMNVIGMGEEKTPRSFRAACSIFTNLELLLDDQEEAPTEPAEQPERKKQDKAARAEKSSTVLSKKTVENDIVGIITENENKGKTTGLGEIGSRLQNKYPDFDVRNYGYSLLSKFLDEISSLELVKEGHTSAEVEHWMADTVRAAGERGMSLSELSNQLHARFQNFHVRDYGYSQFSKFVQSIPGLELGRGSGKHQVYWVE